jgi:23S rRNA pseudouridine1911/1915/1917 synthase
MNFSLLDILLEDGPVLAVSKPPGLLTQAPPGVPSLEACAREFIKQKYSKPGNVYLGIPHRLDRPTSGVVVFARNSKAAARLAEQFHDRRVRKEYLAVVDGIPPQPHATLTDWLLKDAARSQVTVVARETPGAKEATLRYRVLESRSGRALLHVEPLTGRMHQIRIQLATRGWPIMGDRQYGRDLAFGEEKTSTAVIRDDNGRLDAIALHARRLTILHPVRYDKLTIEAPVPLAWEQYGFEAEAADVSQDRSPPDVDAGIIRQ